IVTSWPATSIDTRSALLVATPRAYGRAVDVCTGGVCPLLAPPKTPAPQGSRAAPASQTPPSAGLLAPHPRGDHRAAAVRRSGRRVRRESGIAFDDIATQGGCPMRALTIAGMTLVLCAVLGTPMPGSAAEPGRGMGTTDTAVRPCPALLDAPRPVAVAVLVGGAGVADRVPRRPGHRVCAGRRGLAVAARPPGGGHRRPRARRARPAPRLRRA